MPNINFTLEDFQKAIDQSIEQALIKEREHTRLMIESSAEDIKQSVRGEFLDFWEANLSPALDGLYDEMHEIKRGRELRVREA